MRSGRHTKGNDSTSGERRATAVRPTLDRLPRVVRALTLGLICGEWSSLPAFDTVADAAPSYREQINSLEAQAEELEAQVADLDRELEIASEAYNQLVVSLDELNVTMTQLRQQKDAAETDYQYRLRLFENRLCDLYKAGGRDEVWR